MTRLAGACTDLAPVAVERYFTATGRSGFNQATGRRICSRCVLLTACRLVTLVNPLPSNGTVTAGMNREQIKVAKQWHEYELGVRIEVPQPPPSRPHVEWGRPDWLPRPEAAETNEQTLVEIEEGVLR